MRGHSSQQIMLQSFRTVACGLFVAVTTSPLIAQTVQTPGPPAWQDGAAAYLVNQELPTNRSDPSYESAASVYNPTPQQSTAAVPIAARPEVDRDLLPAVHAPAAEPEHVQADRYLAPPTEAIAPLPAHSSADHQQGHRDVPDSFGASSSLYTVGCALAIVIGAFLVCAWLLRRGAAGTAAVLPADVVSVLGRVPLAARQFAQLLRVGNKLVLVSLSPGGVETITEVTDAAEVDRLAGLCQQSNPHSTTKAFEQVFQQLAHERTPNSFLGNDPLPSALSSPPEISLFRTPRSEAARA
jgi:flagellar biogenesis protein FliO